jgi:nitronate monooxygenase
MNSFSIGDLKIPLPIIQGGMGVGISLSGLASAVANEGGIGVISTVGIGFIGEVKHGNFNQGNIDAIRAEIRRARELSDGIIGVNIMTVLTNYSEMVQTAIEEDIDIIFSGAGLPLDLPGFLKAGSRTKLVPIVSSGRAASIICNKWKPRYNYLPDAIVVEGPLAGGHIGFKSSEVDLESNRLENLVADVLKVSDEMKKLYGKDIPVIAAGGIFSGGDMLRFLKLGASAVQLGTRFVATEECDASLAFKQAFIGAVEADVRIIESPVGMPGRSIYNNFLYEAERGNKRPTSCKFKCIKTCNPLTTPYCIANALLAANKGDFNEGFAFAGANVYKVNSISSVASVFEELKKEYALAEKESLSALPLINK